MSTIAKLFLKNNFSYLITYRLQFLSLEILLFLWKTILFSKVGQNIFKMDLKMIETNDLSQIYPDVSAELCNKHVKRLSQLKNLFGEVYDELEPEKYVIVNGIAKVIDLGNDLQLNFALENGIVALYSKTYKDSQLFINGNHLDEEIIFNPKGKHIEGIHERVYQIKNLIRIIRGKANPQKEFYGGILYIHSNIGQNLFGYQQCFMLATAISLLLVHEELQYYSREDILKLVSRSDQKLSTKLLQNLLNEYQINKCVIEYGSRKVATPQPVEEENQLFLNLCNPNSDKSIGTHESNQSIHSNTQKNKTILPKEGNDSISSLQEHETAKLEDKTVLKIDLTENSKLILCKLDLSIQQEEDYKYKVQRIKFITDLIHHEKMSNLDKLEQNQDSLKSSLLQEVVCDDEIGFIKYSDQIRQLLARLMTKQIEFTEFLKQKHELDVEYEILDEQVVDLINQIRKQTNFLQNFCVIEGNTLLISMDKQYYAQIMVYLRQLLNNFKLSTSRFLSTKQKLRIDSMRVSEISEIMFTTSPSLGCGIYHPSEDIWI